MFYTPGGGAGLVQNKFLEFLSIEPESEKKFEIVNLYFHCRSINRYYAIHHGKPTFLFRSDTVDSFQYFFINGNSYVSDYTEVIQEEIEKLDYLIIADYRKTGQENYAVQESLIKRLVNSEKFQMDRKPFVIMQLHPQFKYKELLKHIDVLLINRDDDYLEKCHPGEDQTVIGKKDKDGCIVMRKDNVTSFKSPNIIPVDPCGAGDIFLASLAASIISNGTKEIEDSMIELALQRASEQCTFYGTHRHIFNESEP